jgi:hypothetical protein
MRQKYTKCKPGTRLAVAAAVLFSPMLVGCDAVGVLGPNFSLNYVLPLGFGGAPGLFNPYGIIQALVNVALGSALPSDSGGDSAAPQGNPSGVNPTTVGAAGR